MLPAPNGMLLTGIPFVTTKFWISRSTEAGVRSKNRYHAVNLRRASVIENTILVLV